MQLFHLIFTEPGKVILGQPCSVDVSWFREKCLMWLSWQFTKSVAGFQCLPQSLKTLAIKESLLNQGCHLGKCLTLLHTKLQANYTVRRKRASLLGGLGNYSGKLKLSRACDAAAEEREDFLPSLDSNCHHKRWNWRMLITCDCILHRCILGQGFQDTPKYNIL